MDKTRQYVLRDVPEEDVKTVRADFETEGGRTTLVRQSDGKWTVLAEFDEDAA
jgi:hypothetical protein